MEQPQLGICELQYLRSLVMCDNLENDYEHHPETLIARNKTMFVFNAEVMQKLDDLEDFISKGGN